MAKCRQCGQSTPVLQQDVFTGTCATCRAGVTPVRLGCGTLILIGFIVAAVSQAGSEDLESEISDLAKSVRALNQTVETQTKEIRELHSRIDRLTELQQNEQGNIEEQTESEISQP